MAAKEDRDERLLRLYDREGRNTSSTEPRMMHSRVFIGNLAAEKVTRQEIEQLFGPYGKILGVSLHRSYGFVQFDSVASANEAVKGMNGTMLHGLKLDINIATERRKDPPRKRHSPSPPPRFRDRYEHERHERFRQWDPRERFGRRSPPPPHFREFYPREPYDPYYDRYRPPHPRDPYSRPRDDPYDRFPRERYPPPRDHPPYPPRDYPIPRDYPPPRDHPPMRDHPPLRDYPLPRDHPPPRDHYDRYPPDYPPPREAYERRLLPPPDERRDGERLVDLEIIVVNRQQKDYAELVRGQVESMGLLVETVHLSPTVSLADALDDAAQRGLLYAMIITSQHEMHRSVTLTILHGRNPQEHKNMPLDDALGLVDRDYDRYRQNAREGRVPPRRAPPPGSPKDEVPRLLAKAASGEQLSRNQLSAVIGALQRQKESDHTGHSSSRLAEQESSHHHSAADDIQRQQADLQAKILSLLGSNAVVPSSSSPSQPHQSSSYDGGRSVSYPQSGYGGYGAGGSERDERGGPSGYDSYGYGYR